MRIDRLAALGILALAFLGPLAAQAADPPLTFLVQGRALMLAGGPAPDGTYAATLSFYKQVDDNAPISLVPDLAIVIQEGVFSVAVTPPSDGPFLDGSARWLGVRLDGEAEMSRAPFNEVPYAARSRTAGALACTGCVTAGNLSPAVASAIQSVSGLHKVAFSGDFLDLLNRPPLEKGDTGPQGPQGEKGEKGELGAVGPTGPSGQPGVNDIYTRWGVAACGTGDELLYQGWAYGSWHAHIGGNTDPICMKEGDPGTAYNQVGHGSYLVALGTYFSADDASYQPTGVTARRGIPCAKCATSKACYRVDGSGTCASGWSTLYAGELVAGHYNSYGNLDAFCYEVNNTAAQTQHAQLNQVFAASTGDPGYMIGNVAGYRHTKCAVCCK